MLKIKKDYLFFLIIFLASFFFLGRAVFPGRDEIIYGGDLLTQFYYWKGYLAQNLRQMIVPFWNPYNFSGTPFLAHPTTTPFYPSTFLFLVLPLNLAFSLNYFIHLSIGGIGLFYFARKYSDRLSSLIGAIAFIWSGYFAARIYAGHVDILTTAVWIPWIMASFISLSQEPQSKKKLITAVFSLAMMILAGYGAYLVFIAFFISLYLVYLFLKKTKLISLVILSYFFAFAASVSLTSIQWIPAWQLSKYSIRGMGLPYDLASWGSLPISGLKLFIDPLNRTELNKITFNLGGGPMENPFDHYPGKVLLITVLLFLFIFIASKFIYKDKNKIKINFDFWFFGIAGLLFLSLSFAQNSTPNLHYLLYSLVPLYRYIRIPIQNLVIPVVLLPVIFSYIISKIKFAPLKLLAGFLVLGDLFLFGRQYIFLTEPPPKYIESAILDPVKLDSKEGRLLPALRVTSPLLTRFDLNFSLKYRIETTSGYDPVILKNYYDFIDAANGSKQSSLLLYNVEIPPVLLKKETLDFLNVNRILTDVQNVGTQDFPEMGKGPGFILMENKNPLPLVFPVYKVNEFESEIELKQLIAQNKSNLSKEINLLKNELQDIPGKVSECTENDTDYEIEQLQKNINSIIFKVHTSCPAFLTGSLVNYPGWRAKIDGKDTRVMNSNIAFRAIYVPSGVHTVEYYYFPGIYITGFLISLISAIGFLLILRRNYR